jgi:hypothetical protein
VSGRLQLLLLLATDCPLVSCCCQWLGRNLTLSVLLLLRTSDLPQLL